MKKRYIAALASLILIFTSISNVFAVEVSDEYDAYEQIAGYISTYYIDNTLTDRDIMIKGLSAYLKDNDEALVELLKCMLSSLDPYSEYFTKDEYTGFVNGVNRTFYGIGVSISYVDDYVTVQGFTSGSAAQEAGIQIGDKISKVNGEDMYKKDTNQVRNAIAGDLGTEVSVTVLRGDTEHTYTIKRGLVNDTTVSYAKLGDNVSYIAIQDMSNHTADEFNEALQKADADGITNIILDLRNNLGGYVDCAVQIAQKIVPEGVIIDTKYRQSFMDKTYKSTLKKPKYKFNVLVNEYTASAAEILASAIQDSGVGQLIGDKTYGKGVIQDTFPLTNGSYFKLTVGKYITRSGKEINGIGLTPDIEIENSKTPVDISKYSPISYKTKQYVGDTADNIKGIKERLYLMRYYSGTIDTNFDNALFDAVKLFQEDNNLYSYGVLDITTQTTIQNAFSEMEVVHDDQLDKAYELFTGEHLPKEEE